MNTKKNEEYYNRTLVAALRISFIALLLVWSYLILKPFIMPVLWGIIMAVVFYPLHKKLAQALGGKEKTSAWLITLVLLTLLIVPSLVFIGSTMDGIEQFAHKMQAGSLSIPPPQEKIAKWPVIGKPIYQAWEGLANNTDAMVTKYAPQLKAIGAKLFASTTHLVVTLLLFILAIIIGGVFLPIAQGGKKVANKTFDMLLGDYGDDFVQLSADIIRSVVQGILLVATIQSVLLGAGMIIAHIPAAGLWALIILFLAILQLPPLLVMLPVAIYGFSIMDVGPAIVFLVYSTLISISDPVLKALFLGRGVAIPMLVVLLGAIGGMILSGILGLFVGPVVLAIAYKVFIALTTEEKESLATIESDAVLDGDDAK